ncbi:YggS family pyridoxal phosphate-dependent enzyme [Erysipelotrichaceae bacterium OttesenSCG-928-M19]|nr:YggS family pyridoxal phosphate-dependent enzyme [Erysipelotrichaceae bacterium OttesenSCG-928-M19]
MKKELEQVLKDIEQYKQVDKVTIVGVTKTQPVAKIEQLISLGITNLGENRPQELRDKYDEINEDVTWHMIGRLQTNKIKYVINRASLIHSVADLKLMSEINKAAQKNNKVIEILLQISTSNEESKQGFNEEELQEALKYAQELPYIEVVGLMCMAPLVADELIVNEVFAKAKEWYDKYNNNFKYLSMGMSTDYIIALKNGANMLRIGSLLFTED